MFRSAAVGDRGIVGRGQSRLVEGIYFMTEGLVPWSLFPSGCFLWVSAHLVCCGRRFLMSVSWIFAVGAVVEFAVAGVAVRPAVAWVELAGECAGAWRSLGGRVALFETVD